MLSQAWYWKDRTADPAGWFYKTQKEWQEETGLTRYEQETARRALRERGFLEEKTAPPYRLYFRIDRLAIYRALGVDNPQVEKPHAEIPQLQESQKNEDAEIPHAEIQQVALPQSSCGKLTCQHAVFPQSITENTAETTTENTEREPAADGGPAQGDTLKAASSDDQADGRNSEKRKRAASQDPPGLVEFRARLKAHREEKLGAPSGASYHTQEINGIRALFAKVEAGLCDEADCLELFDSKYKAWLNRGMSGYTPNWIYVAQDIEPYIKGRAVVIQMPQKKTGFLTQADINSPRRNRVCL